MALLHGLAAQDTDLIVETHLECALLIVVSADESIIRVALYHLPYFVDVNIRIVLCSTFKPRDVLGLMADFLPASEDVVVAFDVSTVGGG